MTKTIFIVQPPSHLDPLAYRIKMGLRNEETGALLIADAVTLTQVPADEPAPVDHAMLTLEPHEMTTLMDAMWNAGVRPSDIGTPGHLAATTKHLEDMRKLVAHHAGVALPK
jgi:hypothetical protein